MGRAAAGDHRASPTAPTAQGYLRARLRASIFLVSSDGGAPRQLSFGALQQWRPARAGRRTAARSCSAATARPTGSARRSTPKSTRSTSPATGSRALTSRDGPDNEPAVSPDGRLIAYTGFDDRERGYENSLLYVMDARRRRTRARSPARSTAASNAPVWAADGRSIYVAYDDRGETQGRPGRPRRLGPHRRRGAERRRPRPALYRRQLQRRPRRRGRAAERQRARGRPTSRSSAAARGGS